MAKTLVFPAVTPTALTYIQDAADRGESTLAAASDLNGEIQASIADIRHIPAIHDRAFEPAFMALLDAEQIERIYCPVSTVYSFLQRFLATRRSAVKLIGVSPVASEMVHHGKLIRRASAALDLATTIGDKSCALDKLDVASILKFSSEIYGESNETKIAAILGIGGSIPLGDIVEIGSLMGRSAFVLMYLAERFNIGNVLTIDPWSASECVQRDSPNILQSVVDAWDYEILAEGFLLSTRLLNPHRRHVHLRVASVRGHEHYATGAYPENLRYQSKGGIALIHIDGNHDYEAVRQDCELWLQHMLPGGWLILDDYIWAHGDGPYRVGNALLESHAAQVERAFVCGKALFVRWKPALN